MTFLVKVMEVKVTAILSAVTILAVLEICTLAAVAFEEGVESPLPL